MTMRSLTLAVVLAGATLTCGDGIGGITDPNSGGGGVVVATPTPAPTVAPTAMPTATAAPGLTCTLPSMPDCGFTGCCREGGAQRFDNEISAAQGEVARLRPEIFNPGGSLRITDREYTAILAAQITRQFGLCARGGGIGSVSNDEVSVKANNNLSQNVDVVIGSSNSPALLGRYTCEPASF